MKPLPSSERISAKLSPPRTVRNFSQRSDAMAKFIISVLFLYKIKNFEIQAQAAA